jgi:AcrR family transcriptional regulator
VGSDIEPPTSRPPTPYRERQRTERRQAYLATARHVVNTQGAQALTMQGVARATGTSEGGIYSYFKNRHALLAELEVEALETLISSYLRGQAAVEATLLQHKVDAKVTCLAQALGMARFWIASENTLPNEIELSRRVFAEPQAIADPEQINRVLPPAVQLLSHGRQRLDAAVDAKILKAGDNLERALMVISSVTGALLTSKLGGWDNQLFDGRRIATDLSLALFAGWGANAKVLDAADAHLRAIDDETLAPAPTPPT